jgi:hypothetical protein
MDEEIENLRNEIKNNPKFKLLFTSTANPIKITESNQMNTHIANNIRHSENDENKKDSEIFLTRDEEKEKLDMKFKELRSNHRYIQADREAEEYISHLRDIGEYNRWSLKLTQLWLQKFYSSNIKIIILSDKFWIEMGIAMMKYNSILNTEDIHLDVCKDFVEGYYFYDDKKITLCSNTLTNFENPNKFNYAVKRHVK